MNEKLIRKMLTASGGPIINGGTPFSITVKGKDRRPAWKRMYLNPNLGDTSKYYNGNILEGVIGLTPGVGDAIDAVKAADAVNNKDYTTAGFLGAGLLLPNIIEKPFKFAKDLYKGYKASKMMKAARKAFNESGDKLEVDAFKSGSKPMYVTPAKGPGSNNINVISNELKDSKYLDLERPFGKDKTLTLRYYINEGKLKQIIGTYKDLYKDRLGLHTNDVDKIYNYIISNPKLLDLNVNSGTTGLLDIIGVSLGYGPKDAVLFKLGYTGLNTGEKVSKDAIESMKTYGYDRTLPGIYNILKKNIERGTLGVKLTDTNGGHVGFGYVKNKLGGKMNILEFLKKGSSIHIKEKNKGKFTSYCGGKVTDKCILKGKNSSNPAIRKRATFAANARKWKHKKGGNILFKLRRYLEGGLTTNNKFDYGQAIGVALDAFSTILLNKAVDASIKNLRALAELLKKKLFYNNYKSLLGLQLDRSPIVNLNRAYIQANNMSDVSDIDQLFLNQEQELLNLKLKNTSRLISSIGGLALSYFSSLGNKNQISTTGKNQISTTDKNNPTPSPIGKTYTTEITKPFNNTADEWRQLIIN